MIGRRTALAFLAGGSAAASLARPHRAMAQRPAQPRIAIVSSGLPVEAMTMEGSPRYRSFLAELVRLGYVEGVTVVIDRWSAGGDAARHLDLARQVVSTNPTIVFGNVLADSIAKLEPAIPIVFVRNDPVAWGIVGSLARPGGNATGFTLGGTELLSKQLQLLHDASPTASRLAIVVGPEEWETNPNMAARRQTADQLGVSLLPILLDGAVTDMAMRRAFESMAEQAIDALVVASGTQYLAHVTLIAELALAARLPSISLQREYADAGLLMSYGPDIPDLYRRAANYVDRILKGGDPAEMPVEQPTKFEFVINLRTAEALGITLPPSIMLAATEFIE